MKAQNRRFWIKVVAFTFAVMMVLGIVAAIPSYALSKTEQTEYTEKPSAQDDFYNYVNFDMIQSAEIPGDQVAVGGFMDLIDEVDENLMADLDAMVKENVDKGYGSQAEMVKLYKLASDFDRLNEEGAEPIKGQLKTIKDLENLKQFNTQAAYLYINSYVLPFDIGVSADMIDATKNTLYVSSAGTILPSKDYYEDNETGELLLDVFSQSLTNVLEIIGETSEDAQKITEDTLKFDALMAKYSQTAEESSEYTSMYNPVSAKQFAAYSKNVPMLDIINKLLPKEATEVVVTAVEFFENIDEIINEETFEMMKNWMVGMTAYRATSYLSDELREAGSAYSMTMNGTTELNDRMEDAYAIANGMFGFALGQVYVENYFSAEAKADVESMVDNMIAIYKVQLKNNDWLSDATKNKAIKKLNAIEVHIGYPEELPKYYDNMKVNTSASLYQNIRDLSRIIVEDNLAKYGTTVDRSEWGMTPQTVNAYYDPQANAIVFPAAILQAPFYSVDQSASQNYGGIGMVIAHEISHAFDNSGSQFDELGNMTNWWTTQDYAEFEKRTQAMINLFDGIEIFEAKANGKLTVGENIADAGGLRCALEATKALPDADLEEFFINYATIWGQKARLEYNQYLLSADVHSANQLRVNIQVANVQEFYDTFGVTSSDAMYIAPEDRVSIW